MKTKLTQLALDWVNWTTQQATELDPMLYCQTRDVFQARLDTVTNQLLNNTPQKQAYTIAALVGEIGNNSFDHNLGQWRDLPGIFFGHDFSSLDNVTIVLADRGQGILATLKKVKPSLENDQEALETAFKEKLSGRAPENRGNGLKFVRKAIEEHKMYLTFHSGFAKAELHEHMTITKEQKPLLGCLAILAFSGRLPI